jgi:hypothetical protein
MAINLKKSSLQRIYEFGLRHIRKQGAAAYDGGSCCMRTPGGLSCVVGSMIDDDLAARCDEGDVPSGPVLERDEWRALIGNGRQASVKAELLRSMQRAHDLHADYADFLDRFEKQMMACARDFNLKYAPPGATLRT